MCVRVCLCVCVFRINQFRGEHGFINNYDLFYSLRDELPLHAIAFKRAAPFIEVEANCERTFSAATRHSDPNMKQSTLRNRTIIGKNKAWYEPTLEEIKQKYKQKFGAFEAPQVRHALHSFSHFTLPSCFLF